jgi:hypothetical protein
MSILDWLACRPCRGVYSSCCQRAAVTRCTLELCHGMVSSGAYVDTRESGYYEPVIFSLSCGMAEPYTSPRSSTHALHVLASL